MRMADGSEASQESRRTGRSRHERLEGVVELKGTEAAAASVPLASWPTWNDEQVLIHNGGQAMVLQGESARGEQNESWSATQGGRQISMVSPGLRNSP
jgi:hypothetical protein